MKCFNHYTADEIGAEMLILSERTRHGNWWQEALIKDDGGYWVWGFYTEARLELDDLRSGKYDDRGVSGGSYSSLEDLASSDEAVGELIEYAVSEGV